MVQNKVEIAKQFVNLHRHSINDWSPKYHVPNMSDEAALLEVYYNLIGGLYGDTDPSGQGELTIEIDSHDSKSGYPVLFDFPDLIEE